MKKLTIYLRSDAISSDALPNKEAIGILQRAVGLDPNYAPAWSALSKRYYFEADYASGGQAMMQRSDAAAERALAIDPNNVTAGANLPKRMRKPKTCSAVARILRMPNLF